MSKAPALHEILVPIDGSEAAEAAVRWAASLAALSGAGTSLLFVYDSREMAALGVTVWESEDSVAEIEREARDEAMLRATRALAEFGVEPRRSASLIGDPAERIVAYAKDQQVDLIVLGYRPHSAVKTLLGSVVGERVLKLATCPVLFVR